MASEISQALDNAPPNYRVQQGFYENIPNELYHRGPGVSQSDLKAIQRSPMHYRYAKDHPKPPTYEMEVGKALHTLVLEPQKFDDQYLEQPKFDGRTTEGKARIAEINDEAKQRGLRLIQTPEMDRLKWMRDALLMHPYASILLDVDAGPCETSVYWEDETTKTLCKIRPDKLNDAHNIACDLKSTGDASYSGFARTCAAYNYMMQAAFYTHGLNQVGRRVKGFWFIVCEREPPWGIGIYELESVALDFGHISWQRALWIYHECLKTNEWPGYPPEPRTLTIPRWGLRAPVS